MISVLYVDDDLQLLEIGKLFLERSGNLSIDIISSGDQAIDMLEKRSYDIIISDYEMPAMDGIELLQIIRERHNGIPFILFTGRGREEVVIKALNEGADSYLQKGGDVNAQFVELENIVKKHVEHKKAEIAAERSEKKYRLLVDNAKEGIFVIQNEKIVFYNPKFSTLIQEAGLILSEIATQSIFDFLHPDDQKIMRERFYRRVKYGENLDKYPFRIIDNYGSIHWFEIDTVITEWNDNPATLNFFWKIYEQQNLELIINKSENRYKELVDSLPKTILEMDENLNLKFINKAGTVKLVYDSKDLNKSLSFMDLLIQSDKKKIQAHKIKAVNGESLVPQEYIAQKKDGSNFPIKIYLSVIVCDNTFAGFRAVCVDISEEKMAKCALTQANKQLNLMTNITRHDILNKITALLTYQDLCRELIHEPIILNYFEKQQQITQIIQEHIEFTQYYQEIGMQTPLWQDLKTIISSAISENDIGLLSIEVNIKSCLIYADPLFKKVFVNIIENSIRHGDHVTKICFSVADTGEGLTIWYTDNGLGVPSEMKELIFKEGYGNHTGFGLFLIGEILSITGITIIENGTFGCGARFEIVVPNGRYKIDPV